MIKVDIFVCDFIGLKLKYYGINCFIYNNCGIFRFFVRFCFKLVYSLVKGLCIEYNMKWYIEKFGYML